MFFFFKENYSECNKNMFSARKGLIYLLCRKKINTINTSIFLLYGGRWFPTLNSRKGSFGLDSLILRLCFLRFPLRFAVFQELHVPCGRILDPLFFGASSFLGVSFSCLLTCLLSPPPISTPSLKNRGIAYTMGLES